MNQGMTDYQQYFPHKKKFNSIIAQHEMQKTQEKSLMKQTEPITLMKS